MEEKLAALLARLKACGSLVVALSGGVDSSTLAKAAALALGDKAVAITARSELLSYDELADAKAMARAAGIRHILVDAHDLDNPDIVRNDKERCYHCKRGRFEKLCAWARENGFSRVADGGNLDDKGDYRPGMRAIEELSPMVVSPFMECGWTKADIRAQARAWGLSVADKPSAACLASRVVYGLPLTAARLAQVEAAEKLVRSFANGQLRVRHHGNLARIEAEGEDIPKVAAYRAEIAAVLKELGFTYVTLDLGGYRMGSTNEALSKRRGAF
ncbi:MAG: ATP-dependent sacrificial sulfur transferase LarE [Schwartzia sp.]|nr:ATP-dependent sacrificial sulfur transferase LarE [Schwartzia sp. (in: firmicutes)]